MFTDEQRKEFESLAKPLIEWLNNNANPMCSITINCDSAEILSGEMAIRTDEFIKD